MAKRNLRESGKTYDAWSLDQIDKSEFFHQKLHEWELLEVAKAIEEIKGEDLEWNLETLSITDNAWRKVIHRGIRPVIIFAHPDILCTISRSVGYYRMLSMVSQKSMNNLGLSVNRYEIGKALPDRAKSVQISHRLNYIISRLIQSDETINSREFDIWRGMAAGSQAQGSWNNIKGDKIEEIIKGIFIRRMKQSKIINKETDQSILLKDGRTVELREEPDIAFYQDQKIIAAIEIKGGIDTAGVLERVGAAIKSLSRAIYENPEAITILILPGISLTDKAIEDLSSHEDAVQNWFTIEEFRNDEKVQEKVFSLVGI